MAIFITHILGLSAITVFYRKNILNALTSLYNNLFYYWNIFYIIWKFDF